MNMNQKGFANIALIVVIVILVGAVGYFAFVNKSEPITGQPTPTPTQTNTAVSPTPTPQGETANWKTYRDTTYGFGIKYPSNWNLKNNVLSFSTKNGYTATFGVEGISPTTKDFTIDEMRKEYDRTSGDNPRAPKAAEILKNIFIGSEAGLEWAGIACEQGNPCYARYEFYSNSTWRKGFKFYLVVPNLKSGDVNSSYDPRPLFSDDITTVRKALSTFKFVN